MAGHPNREHVHADGTRWPSASCGQTESSAFAVFVQAEIYRCCLHDLKEFRTRAELEQAVRSFVKKVTDRIAVEKVS